MQQRRKIMTQETPVVDIDRDKNIDLAVENYKRYEQENEKEVLNYPLMKTLVETVPKLLGIIQEQNEEIRILKDDKEDLLQRNDMLTDQLLLNIQCLKEYK